MEQVCGDFTEGLVRDCGFSSSSAKLTEASLANSLRLLGIISDCESIIHYRELGGWERGGAETYVATAEVLVRTSRSKARGVTFVAKAISTFGMEVEEVASVWIFRRSELARYIMVPRLFSYHNGVIYEEFIPHTVAGFWEESKAKRNGAIKDLAQVASALDILGFHPVSIVPNLRVKNDRMYWVDFGADLGSATGSYASTACQLLKKELTLDTEERTRLEGWYRHFFALYSQSSPFRQQY